MTKIECSSAKPQHPRDHYPHTLEHVWAYMRNNATTPHVRGGVPGYVFTGTQTQVIRALWPGLPTKEVHGVQAYIGNLLNSTHRVMHIGPRSGPKPSDWWVAATFDGSPEPQPQPTPIAPTAPAPIIEGTPIPASAVPSPVRDRIEELVDALIGVADGQNSAELDRLREENALLSARVAELTSRNEALCKHFGQAHGDVLALAARIADVLGDTA